MSPSHSWLGLFAASQDRRIALKQLWTEDVRVRFQARRELADVSPGAYLASSSHLDERVEQAFLSGWTRISLG
jgi:hypothetical protein